MLEWLTGRKKRRELPEYSRLRAVPTRPLPPELARDEAGELFRSRRTAIEEGLRRRHDDPQGDSPQFTSLIAAGGRGVIANPMPDGDGQCLPVFSSPVRAADYRQMTLASVPVQYLSSTAAQLAGMIRDVEQIGIGAIALDRCPRCSIFTVTGTRSLKAPGDLLALWAIHKSTEMARLELYVSWALRAARAGQLEAAREVALETVGHVSLEDPRSHALLGELAVGLGDPSLLQEAQAFLRFLKHESWERQLALVAEAGKARFEGFEEPRAHTAGW